MALIKRIGKSRARRVDRARPFRAGGVRPYSAAAAHLAASQESGDAIEAARSVLAVLPSSSASRTVESVGMVRGRIKWDETVRRRMATSDPTIFVCAPPERMFDTKRRARLLVSLQRCAGIAGIAGLPDKGELGMAVDEVSSQARLLLRHPKLAGVTSLRGDPSRVASECSSTTSRDGAHPDVARLYDPTIGRSDPVACIEHLERHVFAPDDARLFELQVGFARIAAFRSQDFELELPVALLPGALRRVASFSSPSPASIHWQRSLWILAPGASNPGELVASSC